MTLLDADVKERGVGLDVVSWCLCDAIEESFGVQLPDWNALLGMTVGELADHICREAKYPNAEKCLSAVAFYRLRRAFIELFGTSREMIRTTTPMKVLLPWGSRKTRWEELQEDLSESLPRLTFPTWLLTVLLGLSLTLSIALSMGISYMFKVGFLIRLSMFEIVMQSVALCFFTMYLAITYAEPFARKIPRGCDSFGGLVKEALARNYAKYAAANGSSDTDVLSTLRLLIASELAIDPEVISPETHFSRDLDLC